MLEAIQCAVKLANPVGMLIISLPVDIPELTSSDKTAIVTLNKMVDPEGTSLRFGIILVTSSESGIPPTVVSMLLVTLVAKILTMVPPELCSIVAVGTEKSVAGPKEE